MPSHRCQSVNEDSDVCLKVRYPDRCPPDRDGANCSAKSLDAAFLARVNEYRSCGTEGLCMCDKLINVAMVGQGLEIFVFAVADYQWAAGP